ncbi:MAG: cyclase [Micrococcales bacterium]|nr:MAG: cyclase [Micrococcales bacterium]PIE27462.1 MAG: cyclase [Micrococcales bacterium]
MGDATSATATIDAAAADVLTVIADLGAYPQWANGVTKVVVDETGPDDLPAVATFTVRQRPITDTYSLEYTWDVDEHGLGTVSWTLRESTALKSMDGSYTLSRAADGTLVRYDLSVSLAVPLAGPLRRMAEKSIVTTALKDLAKRVGEVSA